MDDVGVVPERSGQMYSPVDVSGDPQRFPLIPFADLRPGTEPAYLIRGIIPRVGLIVGVGPPKCGKTSSRSTSRCTWRSAANTAGARFKVGRSSIARSRARRASTSAPMRSGSDFSSGSTARSFYLMPAQIDLIADHYALIDAIRDQLGERGPVLVALDTLNRSLRGSENDDVEDMSAYIRGSGRRPGRVQLRGADRPPLRHRRHPTARPHQPGRCR